LRELYFASVNETIIGYVTLIWKSPYLPFAQTHIPEIKDLNVIVESRCRGYGTRLIKHVEQRARAAGHQMIGIGTELTPDYDAAQRLYPALGYVPDGRGKKGRCDLLHQTDLNDYCLRSMILFRYKKIIDF
jgi:GNAT superfamily N-acetyltransferase